MRVPSVRYSHPHQLTAGGLLAHLSASRDGRTVRSFVTRRVADEDDARKIHRSGCLRAERHCRCVRARRLILWRRARSRRDGYDLLACTGLPPVRRDHPEAGLSHTRKAVAYLGRTFPAPDAPVPGWQRTARNAADRRRPGNRGVYSVPVVSAKISSAIW
jgi:hypothetical protein